jgi:serine/threonine protein kinase
MGKYVITKQLQKGVWLTKCEISSESQSFTICLTNNRNWAYESVIIKSVADHPPVDNEQDVLKRFQNRTSYVRPLIDEIIEPSNPTAMVLKRLDGHLLSASSKPRLKRKEIKHVSKCILETLKVLHENNYIHTGSMSF